MASCVPNTIGVASRAAIAVRQFGRFEAVANFENILNVRQTDTDPLVRPTATTGGRWTTDLWAPLEGFMANVAFGIGGDRHSDWTPVRYR
jgi:hypothetical protein